MPKTAEQVLEEINGTANADVIDPGEVEDFLNQNETPDDPGKSVEGTPDTSSSLESPDGSEEFRTLADLNEGSGNSSFKLNATEKARVKIAVKNGFTTDEQIDQYLVKTGKKPETQEKELKTEDDKDEKSDESEVKNEDDTTNDDGENNDDNGDIDSKLLKVIGPHLDKAESVDDAVTAIKNLQYRASRTSEFVNKATKLGFDSVDKIEQAVNTMNNIDSYISESLKTPEGLQKLYKEFNIQPPKEFGRVNPANVPNGNLDASSQTQGDLNEILNKFEDDGLVDAATFKSVIPAIISQVRGELEKEYSTDKETVKKLSSFVQQHVQKTERSQAVTQVFQDVREISDKLGNFDNTVKLSADPVTIWKDSVGPDNKIKKQPHEEFGKLQQLLKMRKGAAKQIRESHAKAGIKNAPIDIIAHLSKQLVTSGKLGELKDKTKKTTTQNLVAQLANRLQPNIRDKKTSSGNSVFKVPKTVTDVKKMSDSDKKLMLKKLKMGHLKVGF